ncbi:MAG: hypothetical protein M3353_06520 [Actinomycetota bacterium]|nr:hypothetical protein [Actinomycetota bacterium]
MTDPGVVDPQPERAVCLRGPGDLDVAQLVGDVLADRLDRADLPAVRFAASASRSLMTTA